MRINAKRNIRNISDEVEKCPTKYKYNTSFLFNLENVKFGFKIISYKSEVETADQNCANKRQRNSIS